MNGGIRRGVLVWALCGVVHTAQAAQPDTAGYARVLAAAVGPGGVDYAAVAANKSVLDAYLAAVSQVRAPTLGPDAKAFYINAYNALVLRAVVAQRKANPALKSVLDVPGFFDRVTYVVAGESLTLNALEEGKLRQPFKDPRIHFAVNCASVGCPALAAVPYAAATLETALEAATVAYMAGPHGVRADVQGGTTVTHLLDWYAGDFGGPAGALAFAQKYAPAAHRAGLKGPLRFHDYNWALNSR